MEPTEQTEPTDRHRYLHLISDAEIKNLRPVLEILRDNREAILKKWHDLYVDHLGQAGTLSARDFDQVYGLDLDGLIQNLLEQDMEGFEADMRKLGLELVDKGVPFAEVVASLHLFEESASSFFQTRLKVIIRGPEIYLTFDKLSHCRMILLAGSYFAGYGAQTRLRLKELEADADRLGGGPSGRTTFHGIVGKSPAMRRVYEQIASAGGGHGAVLVSGESGTGKELVARALHECAGAGPRPFVAVNCAALPRELIESELFGHKKGAYTGAQVEYAGLIRSASTGTLFLDEITEMASETQAKLLRVLEERMVRPVGSPREIPVAVRFIASTNRDPEQAVETGALRKDLYYRLNVHRLVVPPLRERLDDIPLLVRHFLELFASRGLAKATDFADDALGALERYAWPGNVRELRNAVEHALTIAKNNVVHREDLPGHVVQPDRPSAAPSAPSKGVPTLADAERDLIRRALEATGGNKLQAARLLGISRHRLYDRLREIGLE